MQPMKGDDMNEKSGHKESQMEIRTPLAHNLKITKIIGSTGASQQQHFDTNPNAMHHTIWHLMWNQTGTPVAQSRCKFCRDSSPLPLLRMAAQYIPTALARSLHSLAWGKFGRGDPKLNQSHSENVQ